MTNKIIRYGLLLLAAGYLFASCEDQVVNKFNDQASLFFYKNQYDVNSKGKLQNDSTLFSFFLSPSGLNQDTIWVDVKLTGLPVNYDRAIPLVQLNGGSAGAAVAGVDYVAFDHPDMIKHLIMPANQVIKAIPVVAKRTTAMKTTEYRLEVGITSNKDFVPGIINQTKYIVKITAMASKPALWVDNNLSNLYFVAFGTWGQEKMKFIIDHLGYTEFDMPLTVDMRVFLNLKAKSALAEYEAANGPLYEPDNITRVTFP